MIYCSKCSTVNNDSATFCRGCGSHLSTQVAVSPEPSPLAGETLAQSAPVVSGDGPTVLPVPVRAASAPASNDWPAPPAPNEPSMGFGFLGFFFPVVGLILFLVWYDSRHLRARSAGIGALVGFLVMILISIILISNGVNMMEALVELFVGDLMEELFW